MKNPFKIRNINPSLLVLQFLIMVIFGIIAIANGKLAFGVSRYLLVIILLITGVSRFLTIYEEKQHFKKALLSFTLFLLISVAILTLPFVMTISMNLLFGIWFTISGLAQIAVCIQCVVENLRGKSRYGISGLISISFGVSLILSWNQKTEQVMTLFGIYLIIFSFSALINACAEVMLYGTAGAKAKNKIRISLPVFMTALLPGKLIDDFNKYFELNKAESEKLLKRPTKYDNSKPLLEVHIHLSADGSNRVGHADFRYKDTVYSYGCYDAHSHSFFELVSDGVLLTADSKKYVEFCTKQEKKILVGFGIALDENQIIKLEKSLADLKSKVIPWKTDLEKGIADENKLDAASLFVKEIGAKFYKVIKGSFRKYFIINTNCVKLVDKMIGVSGIGLFSMNGIIVPGSYYSLLNQLFESKESTVIERNIYKDINV